jgi:co-chaperonin GroES (HSP10)
MNADVLLKLKPHHEASGSTIFYKEDISQNDMQNFTVIAVGPDVKYVKVGNTVLASWKRITPPFALESSKKEYGVTAEKEIMAIIEE